MSMTTMTTNTKQTPDKRRRDRFYQQKHRGSKQSYVTEIENLRVLLAWEAGVLSEGQAVKLLNTCRVDLRELRLKTLSDIGTQPNPTTLRRG